MEPDLYIVEGHEHVSGPCEIPKGFYNEVCHHCGKNVQGSAFGCWKCRFLLHKSCVELVKKYNRMQFDRLLYIDETRESYPNKCPNCSRWIPPPSNNCKHCIEEPGEDQEDSASLVAEEEEIEESITISEYMLPPCGGLPSPIWSLCDTINNGCSICQSFIDGSWNKSSEDPIRHPFHPQHLLTKQQTPGDCQVCFGWDGFMLKCEACNFYLHPECSPPMPTLKFDHRQHPFFLVQNRLKLAEYSNGCCTVCGKTGDDMIFKCMFPGCRDYLHVHCAPLTMPASIKHYNHWDPLVFTDSFVDAQDDEHYCDLCEMERDTTVSSVYRCEECNFNSHTACALKEILPTMVEDWVTSEAKAQSDAIYAVNLIKERKQMKISALISDHENIVLSLSIELDDVTRELKRMQSIYSPNRDQLVGSQQRIQHPLHAPHPLSLHLSSETDPSEDPACSCCRKKEFDHHHEYRCDHCKFRLHIGCGCASSSDPTLKIRTPEHFLVAVKKPSIFLMMAKCSSCGLKLGKGDRVSPIFACMVPECRYALHVHCLPVPLPEKINHKYHPYHDLVYTKPEETVEEGDCSDDDCYCDDPECERDRNPNFPFYYCKECGFGAHVVCCISEVLPSLIEEFEYNLLARGISLDAFLPKFEQDFIYYRSKKEEVDAKLTETQAEISALREKLSQVSS